MFSSIRASLRRLKAASQVVGLRRQWHSLRRSLPSHPVRVGSRAPSAQPVLVVIPSDPRTLVGARGDEAMLMAVLTSLRAQFPTLQAHVLTETPEADRAAQSLGYLPLQILQQPLPEVMSRLGRIAPDFLVVIGADSMDGHYNALRIVKILAISDLLARQSTQVTVTGFSFVASPSPLLRPSYFSDVSKSVMFNVRDNRSLARFKAYCDSTTQLVADVAFLLEPAAQPQRFAGLESWMHQCRAEGHKIVGINLHPMLCSTPESHATLIQKAAQALREEAKRSSVRFLLIPHDFRKDVGDGLTLNKLAEVLATDPDLFRMVDGEPSAAELKHLASQLDGLLTGRMHLAIATLGMGVPVAAVTYAEKFEGLFDHFQLHPSPAIAPTDCIKGAELQKFLGTFIDQLDTMRATVRGALPHVKVLSQANLASLNRPQQRAA